jgi:biopolymer transport protein ExbB
MINTLLPVGIIFLMGKTPMELFIAGGPIMWPIILLSFVAVTVVIERVIFALREKKRRQDKLVHEMLADIERGDFDSALATGRDSTDFRARVMVAALENREGSMSDAFGRQSSEELARYSQGLV